MSVLETAVAEIESHVDAAGWERGPLLFALVRAGRFVADDPETATRLGIDALDPEMLTPVEQSDLPEGSLDEVLGAIEWPDSVDGCAVSQEIVILPPEAEHELADDDAAGAAAHPDRREARIVVGVVRGGESMALLRLRDDAEELLTGADLAPNLVEALLATLT